MINDDDKPKIDSSKDNQKPTQDKPKPRRKNVEIMNAIFDSIQRFPKSTYSIAKDTGSTIRTARRFLEVMKHRDIVSCYKDKFGEYWVIKK